MLNASRGLFHGAHGFVSRLSATQGWLKPPKRRNRMLKYAIIFALISLVAGALGFGGVAAGSAGIAKILFGLFLILAVVFIVLAALGVGAVRKVMK